MIFGYSYNFVGVNYAEKVYNIQDNVKYLFWCNKLECWSFQIILINGYTNNAFLLKVVLSKVGHLAHVH